MTVTQTEIETSAATQDAASIANLNDLAWQLADSEMIRAYALAERAHALAGALPDEHGVAYSLRTLGILNLQLGNTEAGIAQLVEARARCVAHQLDDGLADVYGGLAVLYRDVGEPAAARKAPPPPWGCPLYTSAASRRRSCGVSRGSPPVYKTTQPPLGA